MRTTSHSPARELGIQMDRAVRPAEVGLKAAEARVAEAEINVRALECVFSLADTDFQRARAKGESVEEFGLRRERALVDKRIAARRLARERDLRDQTAKRLATAIAYAERLRNQVGTDEAVVSRRAPAMSREQTAMAEALRRAGVDPVSARRAATAPAK